MVAPFSFLTGFPSWIGFLQVNAFHFCIHLDARNIAAASPGSVNELCLEVCSPHVPAQPDGCRSLALHGRWLAAVVVCSAILLLAYAAMGWGEMRRGKIGPRSYRYAE